MQHDVAHFGHLLQFCLAYCPYNFRRKTVDNDNSSSEHSPAAFDWPRMLFRVVASDGWGRRFVNGLFANFELALVNFYKKESFPNLQFQGYAAIPLPPNPGIECIQLECWRPADRMSKLRMLQNVHLGEANLDSALLVSGKHL